MQFVSWFALNFTLAATLTQRKQKQAQFESVFLGGRQPPEQRRALNCLRFGRLHCFED